MLPAPDTDIFTFAGPEVNPTNNAVLMVRRKAPATVFAALHEPFKGGNNAYRISGYERIAENEHGIAVAVRGKNLNDRVLLRYGDSVEQSLTLEGNGESFTFTDYAHIRIDRKTVTTAGSLSAMKLKVVGSPRLVLDGKKAPSTVADGVMTFSSGG